MISDCRNFMNELGGAEGKELITTLRSISAGKINLEVAFARLRSRVAKIKEAEGCLKEPEELITRMQVTNFATMEDRHKVKLILEKFRLCVASESLIKPHLT